ncbi:MAG: hypothetical protein ABI625_18985, partial [bacterium]
MRIRPVEYTGVSFRAPPLSSGLWFSEGLTIFYADALLRRAGVRTTGLTYEARLATLIERYLGNSGATKLSAEVVSRAAYNAGPMALGDYNVSTHMQGELIGTMLNLIVRDATNGARSMDDVMRTMYQRFTGRGFVSADVQHAVESVCSCSIADFFAEHITGASAFDFNHYLAPLGIRMNVTWQQAVDPQGKPSSDLRMWGWQAG